MSGQAIVISTLITNPVALAVLGGAATVMAARLVKDILEAQYQQAQHQRAARQREIATWQEAYQAASQQADQWAVARENLCQQWQTLQISTTVVATEDNADPRTRGFVAAEADLLAPQLQKLLDTLPNDVRQSLQPTLGRLQQRLQDLDRQLQSGIPSAVATRQALQPMLEPTFQQALQELDKRRAARQQWLEQAQQLFGEILLWQQLCDVPTWLAELTTLQDHLIAWLAADQPTAQDLTVLTNKFQQIRTDMDRHRQQQALHQALQRRLIYHL